MGRMRGGLRFSGPAKRAACAVLSISEGGGLTIRRRLTICPTTAVLGLQIFGAQTSIRRRLTICPTTAVLGLQIFGAQTSMPGNPGQDSAAQFGVIVKGELIVGPASRASSL